MTVYYKPHITWVVETALFSLLNWFWVACGMFVFRCTFGNVLGIRVVHLPGFVGLGYSFVAWMSQEENQWLVTGL